MAASALIKFTQAGVVSGVAGQALFGVLGTNVFLTNSNDADVASWQIDLVYADPNSSLAITIPFAFSDNSNTPAAVFLPDVRGSYRWVLKVWSVINRIGDPSDVDIRVFSVPEANSSVVLPSQIWPLPLPDPRSGLPTAKPNELNYSGQLDGWAGNDDFSVYLMNSFIRAFDADRPYRTRVATTTAGQHIVGVMPTSQWPINGYARVRFDILADNGTGGNFMYVERASLFRISSLHAVTHLSTGELVYGGVGSDDGAANLVTPHDVQVLVDGSNNIVVAVTPTGANPGELDLIWNVTARMLLVNR